MDKMTPEQQAEFDTFNSTSFRQDRDLSVVAQDVRRNLALYQMGRKHERHNSTKGKTP